jgi:murein DD-endopeptidase MepM/ murein hydrolase activator NlpD
MPRSQLDGVTPGKCRQVPAQFWGALLGNHVVLDLGGGIYAVLAHLKRGSIGVQKGQVVRVGQKLAECGNSGNSSEPHIHFQLMDTPRAAFAAGLPFRFCGHDMPKNGKPLVSA